MLPSPSEIIFMPTIHVVGAGISRLSAAIRAARSGIRTIVYEATGHAGGRARSFYDEKLGCMIDNGNHLLLGANKSTMIYLSDTGAQDMVKEIKPAVFPFLDAKTGECWRIQPGRAVPPGGSSPNHEEFQIRGPLNTLIRQIDYARRESLIPSPMQWALLLRF